DVARGRFVDDELGALGYEGSHMLAVLQDLGEPYALHEIHTASFENALLSGPLGLQVMEGQGSASISGASRTGVEIDLYTSMVGAVKYDYPPFGRSGGRTIPAEDGRSRHRVMSIEGRDPRGAMVT